MGRGFWVERGGWSEWRGRCEGGSGVGGVFYIWEVWFGEDLEWAAGQGRGAWDDFTVGKCGLGLDGGEIAGKRQG